MNLWLKELKSIAYEMEDVMDEYTYELLRDQVESQNKGASTVPSRKRKSMEDEEKVCFSMPSALLNDMLHKIQTIRERLNEIEKDRSTLNLRDLGPRLYDDGSINPSLTSSFVDESTTIFGQNGDKKAVIELLFADMSCKFSFHSYCWDGRIGEDYTGSDCL
ncbi:hypothetical protein J5N97_014537 [Dioscorea zingiberensis]|uniref:Disease resistance N-terminal domain-containing protein n=1 Tax=Dioscorea zingiberensis TaxID=325984 RepID=A0A9D5CTN0_9LILI|nr:hypothetical protein J5N97_014537 [Dioscorea zingiberensis]